MCVQGLFKKPFICEFLINKMHPFSIQSVNFYPKLSLWNPFAFENVRKNEIKYVLMLNSHDRHIYEGVTPQALKLPKFPLTFTTQNQEDHDFCNSLKL